MYCQICGSKVGETDTFCPICGAKITDEQHPKKEQKSFEIVSAEPEVPPKKEMNAARPMQQLDNSVGSDNTVKPHMYPAPNQQVMGEVEEEKPAKDVGNGVVLSIILPGYFFHYLGNSVYFLITLVVVIVLASNYNTSTLGYMLYIGQIVYSYFAISKYNKEFKLRQQYEGIATTNK